MFRIKICGIRAVAHERDAARFGADAIGLNFCPQSRRYLDAVARKPFEERPAGGPLRVGVFVNESLDTIQRTATECHLDAIQLHGDEPAAMVAALRPLAVVRAFRSSPDCVALVQDFLQACASLECNVAAVLIDAAGNGSPGGTGQLANWALAGRLTASLENVPLVLAGGLTSQNIEAAIASVRPFGVDVASGVERDGVTDPVLVRHFVAAARRGLGLSSVSA
jgi:phosphoribosylanthranilate isomerase